MNINFLDKPVSEMTDKEYDFYRMVTPDDPDDFITYGRHWEPRSDFYNEPTIEQRRGKKA